MLYWILVGIIIVIFVVIIISYKSRVFRNSFMVLGRNIARFFSFISKSFNNLLSNPGFLGFVTIILIALLLVAIRSPKKGDGGPIVKLDPDLAWMEWYEKQSNSVVAVSAAEDPRDWAKWADSMGYAQVCYEVNSRWGKYIQERCRAHGFLEWKQVVGRAVIESAGDPKAVSADSAIGLMGVKIKTAQEIIPGLTAKDLKDPYVNIEVAIRYLVKLQKSGLTGEDLWLAYRYGPTGAKEKVGAERTAPYKAIFGVLEVAGI